MTAWNPADELRAALTELTQQPETRQVIGPPPRRPAVDLTPLTNTGEPSPPTLHTSDLSEAADDKSDVNSSGEHADRGTSPDDPIALDDGEQSEEPTVLIADLAGEWGTDHDGDPDVLSPANELLTATDFDAREATSQTRIDDSDGDGSDLSSSTQSGVSESDSITGSAERSTAGRGTRGRPGRTEQSRGTSAQVPVPLADALTLRRLSETAVGRRFVVNDWLNDQILALPTPINHLLKALGEHADAINLGRAARTEGWTPTKLVAMRLTERADQHLSRLVLTFFQSEGRQIDRQTLISLAISRGLDQAPS